ncbi:MAG: SRPBCC family protein [Gemmatimonadaceae bacterium]
MLTISFFLVALSLVALGAVTLGGRLPSQHVASVKAHYAASPDTLWALVSDPLGAAAWRKDLVEVARVASSDGVLRWRERSKRRAIEFEALPSVVGRRFTTRMTQDDLPFAGQWDYELSSDGTGTVLVITERGTIRSPLFRVLARYIVGYTHSLESYHRSLAARLGEQPPIVVLQNGR